jgi:hypothetical protein
MVSIIFENIEYLHRVKLQKNKETNLARHLLEKTVTSSTQLDSGSVKKVHGCETHSGTSRKRHGMKYLLVFKKWQQ